MYYNEVCAQNSCPLLGATDSEVWRIMTLTDVYEIINYSNDTYSRYY